MKRMLCLLLATSMALTLFGCSSETDKSKSVDAATVSVGSTTMSDPVLDMPDGLADQNIGDVYYSVPAAWLEYSSHDSDDGGETISYHSLGGATSDSAFATVIVINDPEISEDNAKTRIDMLANVITDEEWVRNPGVVKSTIDDRYYAKIDFVNAKRDETYDTLLYIIPVYDVGKLMITVCAKTGSNRDLQADCDMILDTLEIYDY